MAVTPAGVHELTRAGHEVFIEAGAGDGSSLPDEEFAAAGAAILPTADAVWEAADLVLKVEEPVPGEYHRMRQGQVLFSYLHLAASRECAEALLTLRVTAIAYETVQLPDGSLPLLAPMSEVAGRMAPVVGAHHRQLTGGVSGADAAKVVVIGSLDFLELLLRRGDCCSLVVLPRRSGYDRGHGERGGRGERVPSVPRRRAGARR